MDDILFFGTALDPLIHFAFALSNQAIHEHCGDIFLSTFYNRNHGRFTPHCVFVGDFPQKLGSILDIVFVYSLMRNDFNTGNH